MVRSGKAIFWTGLTTALLAVSPAKAQGCEDCNGDFPVPKQGFADELTPETGIFAKPLAVARDRFVSSALNRVMDLNEWSLRIVGVSDGPDMPDFAIALQTIYSTRGRTVRLVGATLAVPSYLYGILFDARNPPKHDDRDDERRAAAARQMSLTEYGDTQPQVTDNEALARKKADINTRLAKESAKTCASNFDTRLGTRAINLMGRTVSRSRYTEGSDLTYPENPQAMTQYHPFVFHFEAYQQGVARDGQLIGSKPALMVEAAMALRGYCWSGDKKYLTALDRALDELEAKLPKER